MKKMKFTTTFLAIAVATITRAFPDKKTFSTEYGLLSATIINDSLYHYTVADLDVLDTLGVDYGCTLGGAFCQVSLHGNTIKESRCGAHKEIIEFRVSPDKVNKSGKGFRFTFQYD